MDELISRAQAIDALRDYLVGKNVPCDGTLTCRLIENEVINKLPTIQPELSPNLAEVGTDCISRQQAIEALYHVDEYNGRSVEAIRNLPPAQPQIIRCKDCKHWIPYDWMFSEMWQSKNIADYPEDDIGCDCCDMAMKANDFCSRGEKREVTT